jgi:hypothetical protein
MNSLDYFNPKLPHDQPFPVNELPPEEQARLRAEFAPLLRSHRRHGRLTILAIVLGIAACILSGLIGCATWAVFLISWFSAFAIALHSPTLTCPNCRNQVTKPRGLFCPDCAKRAVMPGGIFSSPKCQACGKKIAQESQNNYTIHACSNCGLWLDDHGVRIF